MTAMTAAGVQHRPASSPVHPSAPAGGDHPAEMAKMGASTVTTTTTTTITTTATSAAGGLGGGGAGGTMVMTSSEGHQQRGHHPMVPGGDGMDGADQELRSPMKEQQRGGGEVFADTVTDLVDIVKYETSRKGRARCKCLFCLLFFTDTYLDLFSFLSQSPSRRRVVPTATTAAATATTTAAATTAVSAAAATAANDGRPDEEWQPPSQCLPLSRALARTRSRG